MFNPTGTWNTTTLLLSDDGNKLYVGARDTVLSLDVSQRGVINMRKQLKWKTTDEKAKECSMKGKDKETECMNFVRVLQFLISTHLYACGTYAFNPLCTYIEAQTFSFVNASNGEQITEDGKGRCPYDPYQKLTAITVGGELYTGTVSDFQGNKPVISRYLGEEGRVDMKVDDSLGWLQEPMFVSSSFIPGDRGNDKVYFFFSELDKEYDFIKKFTVSRVAQVCTNDIGGVRILQKRWTTLVKAQILCLAQNELPYNVLQDIFTLLPPEGASRDDTVFYGVFSSQWSGNSASSAVCAFQLRDIKKVFDGEYKQLNRDTQRWRARDGVLLARPGQCGLHNDTDQALTFVKENFLADTNVHPMGGLPSLISSDQRYRKIAVQRKMAADGKQYTILFLLTETGFLHKAVLLSGGPHIIEEIQLFKEPQAVENIVLSVKKGVVFVGSSEGVFQVPVSNCSFYWSCADCILARDPFCGWDPVKKVCADVSLTESKLAQDVEKGNVEVMCSSSIGPRARFPSQQQLLLDKQMTVSLNSVLKLSCPSISHLATLQWERDGKPVSSEDCVQLQDGKLHFLATNQSQGEYVCLAIENGFRQPLARYVLSAIEGPVPDPSTEDKEEGQRVGEDKEEGQREEKPIIKQTSSPSFKERSFPSVNKTPNPPGTEVPEKSSTNGPSYYKELVAVSIFLALALTLLLVGTLYGWRQRNRGKARVQGCQKSPKKNPEAGSTPEHVPLTQDHGPVSVVVQNSQGTGGKEHENNAQHASNGHLPSAT
ncbi:SEM4A protein, partial [Amia calva]|nr:SEM4A protein [Amia calva]